MGGQASSDTPAPQKSQVPTGHVGDPQVRGAVVLWEGREPQGQTQAGDATGRSPAAGPGLVREHSKFELNLGNLAA